MSGASVRQGSGTRRSPPRRCGWAGGAVERWAANAHEPRDPAAAATASPSTGCTSVASTVTRIGPRMKTTSSKTASRAYAVCTCAGRSSTCAQRARTAEPIWGSEPPATAAATYDAVRGQSAWTDQTSSEVAMPKAVPATARTGPCPQRSSSRPCAMASTALATM
nr:hypothetical protein [uncultured Nocardioides sp.]